MENDSQVNDQVNKADLLLEEAQHLCYIGKEEEAVPLFHESIKLCPNSRSYYELGKLYLKWGDFSKAAENLESARNLLPDHTPTWFEIAKARRGKGDVAGALEEIERLLEQVPDHPAAKLAKFDILFESGELSRAATFAEHSHEVTLSRKGRVRLAAIYFLLGRVAEYEKLCTSLRAHELKSVRSMVRERSS